MVLPKITGLLFNCSMNCALPTLLGNIDKLAELEEKNQLPSPDDDVYKNYTRLKEGFIRYYGINNPGLFSWQQFNAILLTHSFYAKEIMFLPIFRNFISENAPNHNYHDEDLWRLRDIQPEDVDSEESILWENGQNPAAGKYNQLDASDAVKLFYNYFGLVGSLELFEFNSGTQEYQSHLIQLPNTLASPAWARTPQQSIQLHLKDGHFELQPHDDLQNATNDFVDEINALPDRLKKIQDELSCSSSAHESNLGLSHLFRYVHSILKNSLSEQIASEHVMTCSAYCQLAKGFLFHNDTPEGRQTFAMILLAIASEDPVLKSTANRLMSKASLSDEEVQYIINEFPNEKKLLPQDERPMSSAFLLKCMGMVLPAGLLMTAAAVLIFMHIIIPPIAPIVIGAVLMVSGVALSGFFACKLMKDVGSVDQTGKSLDSNDTSLAAVNK